MTTTPHIADTLLMLAIVAAVLTGLWWLVPLGESPTRADEPDPEPGDVLEVLWLHPHDVAHRKYLTARALDRGLRASARRAGLLTLPAAALLPSDGSRGALIRTGSDERRLQVMARRSSPPPPRAGSERPYRLANGRILVRQDKGQA